MLVTKAEIVVKQCYDFDDKTFAHSYWFRIMKMMMLIISFCGDDNSIAILQIGDETVFQLWLWWFHLNLRNDDVVDLFLKLG